MIENFVEVERVEFPTTRYALSKNIKMENEYFIDKRRGTTKIS